MTPVVAASVLLRLLGVGYSLVLLVRSGDRRFGFLTLMLALMAVRQAWTATTATTGIEELPGLVVSVLAVLAVHFLAAYVEEERSVKERLSATNDRLREFEKAVEHAGHAIFITETDGTITYANPAVESVTGYGRDELIGENPRLWKSGEHDESFYDDMWADIKSGDVWEGEIINERRNGEHCWVDMTIAPITDADGAVERFVAVDTDVTERKEREFRIEQQNDRLATLNTTNEVLRDVNRELVAAGTREEIERTVCEQFAAREAFAFAWFGHPRMVDGSVTPRAHAGLDDDAADDLVAALADADGDTPLSRALDEERVAVTGLADRDEAWATRARECGAAAVLTIPVRYGSSVYGVLNVYAADRATVEAIDRDVFAELGRTVGYAINAVESKRALVSDDVTELEFRLTDEDVPWVDVVTALDCSVEVERLLGDADGQQAVFASFAGVDRDEVVAYADAADWVEAAAYVCADDDAHVFRLVPVEASMLSALADYGAVVTALSAGDGEATVTVEMPSRIETRTVVTALRDVHPDATLVAQRERRPNGQVKPAFRAEVESELTGRQLEAVRTAYAAGFFDWPRENSGDDVAAMMDISQSTFLQHLRAAQRKLLDSLFDTRRVPADSRELRA
ncbi:bacterio-opsin activator domain-containing protein [Halomicrococcus gelatinilyticus]|uniref:bacterio-opsin activator domain-containing protein n=1 Tax=Halomicrococcus gelatinilyticus TaxID=1702103 RepID=UPI002E0E9F3C